MRAWRIVECSHDDQDAIAPQARASMHLIGVEHEILAQHRQGASGARRVRNSDAPWKDGVSVSTERQAAPPAS
jgi:hypothetical protein